MASENVWRILIIDDQQANETSELIKARVDVGEDKLETEVVETFDEGLAAVESRRCDLVLLDLRDDSIQIEDEERLPGLTVYDRIRNTRFVPVVFYTALPRQAPDSDHPCVRVVTRGQYDELFQAVREILDTGLVQLNRHIEEEQRDYLWKTVREDWGQLSARAGNQTNGSGHLVEEKQVDLAYLLSRRLASILRQQSVRRFIGDRAQSQLDPDNVAAIHPVEMYLHPVPDATDIRAGHIYKKTPASDEPEYWIILTPSCDIAQKKVDNVLLAGARPFELHADVAPAFQEKARGGAPSPKVMDRIEKLIQGRRGDRYYYLPGTFFLVDLLVDLQELCPVKVERSQQGKISIPGEFELITTLDTPFGEALVNQFGRYYGRIGTPDLHTDTAKSRLGLDW